MTAIYWVELRARLGRGAEVLRLLSGLAQGTAHEAGALAYGVHAVEGDPDRIALYERYVDAAAAQAHMDSRAVRDALAAFADLLLEPPKLTALEWSAGFGMDRPA